MTEHYLIKLSPRTPFHFGEMMDMERTEVIIRSDTLFSALCYISDQYLGKENYNEFIIPFIKSNPPFLLSSAFPYIESPDKTLFFFPKPLIFKEFVERYVKNIKVFKKIKFISEALLNAYLTGDDEFLENQFQDTNGNIKSDNFIQGNTIWLSKEERRTIPATDQIWKRQRDPRIVINRKTKETSIYHYTRVYFNKTAGLYYLVKILDKNREGNILNDLVKKMRYLGDTGIGGERSLGNGQFEVKLNSLNSPFTIKFQENGTSSNWILSLSLTLPKESDVKSGLLGENTYYQLITRKGWISGTPYLKKAVNMLAEGSVLRRNGQDIIGKIVDITPEILQSKSPEYKIHRYGYSYHLSAKIK